MCNSCAERQYCEDCKAETPLFLTKPSRSRVFIRKNKKKPRVIVNGDVVYIEGQPFQLNHNIEMKMKKGKKEIFASSKDKKFSFKFRKDGEELVLIKMQKNNFEEKPNKKPIPTPEILITGKFDSEIYIKLANGYN